MRVNWLQWDDYNIEHIAKHCVTPSEVVEICFGVHICRAVGNSKYVLSGQSEAGRYINVVVKSVGKSGGFRPITAFEMSDRYKARYRKKLKRGESRIRSNL